MHIGRRFLINALKSCSSSSFVKILSIVLMLIMLKIEPCLLIKNVNPVDAIKYRPILRIAREGFANFVHNDDDYLYQINMKRGVSIYDKIMLNSKIKDKDVLNL